MAAILCMAAMLLTSCHKQKTAEAAAASDVSTTVKTQVVTAQPVGDALTVSGDIEGWRTVKMSFMVAGKIDRFGAEEGQMVRKGALLAQMDATNYNIGRELADVQVRQAEDEFKRLSLMHQRQSVSESDFNKCRFALDGARAQLRLRDKEVSDTRLFASLGGILLKKLAEPGEVVSAGMPVAVVSDISRVKVSAYIPENELSRVRIGQTVSVRVAAIDRTVSGTVREVSGMADPESRSFTVKVEVSNRGLAIRPGMIAEVSIPVGGQGERLVIPTAAVQHSAEGVPYVYVADAKSKKAFRRNIGVGAATTGGIEVASGLKAGEIIVVGGQQKLANGSKILVRN